MHVNFFKVENSKHTDEKVEVWQIWRELGRLRSKQPHFIVGRRNKWRIIRKDWKKTNIIVS